MKDLVPKKIQDNEIELRKMDEEESQGENLKKKVNANPFISEDDNDLSSHKANATQASDTRAEN